MSKFGGVPAQEYEAQFDGQGGPAGSKFGGLSLPPELMDTKSAWETSGANQIGPLREAVSKGATLNEALAKQPAIHGQPKMVNAGVPDTGVRGGYLARRAGGGVANLVGLPFDLANMAGEATGLWSPRDIGSQQIKAGVKDYTGLDLAEAPKNDNERYLGAISEFAGSSVLPGLGMAAKALPAARAAILGGEALSSVLGGAGQEAARDMDPNNPWAPVYGGIAGSLSPIGALQTARATRGLLRGGAMDWFRQTPNKAGTQAVQAGQAFDATGITPTSAQIAPKHGVARVAERVASWLPGGSGRYSDALLKQTEDASGFVDKTLQRATGQAADPTAAGIAIKSGVDTFTGRTGDVATKLFDDVAKHIPQGTIVQPIATENALTKLMQRGGQSPEIQALTQSPFMKKVKDAFDVAFQKGGIDYQALKDLRTKVGALGANMFDQANSGVSGGELKLLYGALSDDMAAAARAAGPQAEKAFNLANRYYAAKQTRLDNLMGIVKDKTPEQISMAFQSLDGTKVRQVMQSVSPAERQTIVGQLMASMGRAKSGVQNTAGDAFSFGEFATNYDKLRKSGALNSLFASKDTTNLRLAIENLNAVSNQVKAAARFLPNASGSGGAVASTAALTSAGTAALTGNLPTAAAIITGSYIAPSLAARLLTSKGFVNWLAAAPKTRPNQWAGHVARLSTVIQDDPHLRGDIEQFIKSIPQSNQ